MKNISWITGINFLLLLFLVVIKSEFLYIPVLLMIVFNTVLCAVFLYNGQKEKLKSLILSALVVTAIGVSSCVTIKPRKKKPPKQKPPVEQPQPPRV